MNLIRKYYSFLVQLRKVATPSYYEKELAKYFSKNYVKTPKGNTVVLIQCVEDSYYFGVFGRIVSSLREKHSIRVEQFMPNSLRPGEKRSIMAFVYSRIVNWSLGNKWIGLYSSFCDEMGYSSTGFGGVLSETIDIYKSYRCFKNIRTKDDLISLVIERVPVGDLINDSYLRFCPAPTVRLTDIYLLRIIWQAHRDIRRALKYFTRSKPTLYLTSHCGGYIQHGIATRVALQNSVRVFSFGNRQDFFKELSLDDWVAAKNPDHYLSEFFKLENQEDKLFEADRALKARLSGHIDRATLYMKKSAYIESNVPVPNVEGALVVFLHCFYDAPHGYRNAVFPDFWEWITFTIECLEESNIKYFIKPHPGWLQESNEIYKELLKLYPQTKVIPPEVTNKQLVQAGMACAVSVHGTVTHEVAYLGVPTISCGDSPHVNFNFCLTTKSRDEYANALLNYSKRNVDKNELYVQSLMFFYMHNLNIDPEKISLLENLAKFYVLCCKSMDYNLSIEVLDNISNLPSFKASLRQFSGPDSTFAIH